MENRAAPITSDGIAPTRRRRLLGYGGGALAILFLTLAICTTVELRPLPAKLGPGAISRAQVLDRIGRPLARSYANELSTSTRPLHLIPPLLQRAVLRAEDKRFMSHTGVDNLARLHAAWSNLKAGRVVRGARTISEQVVRILNPRPSSVWTRWIETFEAMQLESRFSKTEILEFYLNQVPYSQQRRGVDEAARLYFNRDLATLSIEESLALAVLIRAPSRLAKTDQEQNLIRATSYLATQMQHHGELEQTQISDFQGLRLAKNPRDSVVEASHFVRFIRTELSQRRSVAAVKGSINARQISSVRTTLDADLQIMIQKYLDATLADLLKFNVSNGAVLVVENETSEVLAWVNSGYSDPKVTPSDIDAVLTPRQPGSTLKPFLYAKAIEQGWTAATLIDDKPLQQSVRRGLHQYQNFSRIHYGPLRLRETLGNSLNIPAVLTLRYVGSEEFLNTLRSLKFTTLTKSIAEYGEGLALGNAEVPLYELVRTYVALARGGIYRPLRHFLELPEVPVDTRIFSSEASAIITSILSDHSARSKEFGANGILNLPFPTAVKTGTSNDFRDSWAVGYSEKYTVGVWMGNLTRRPTEDISGARGPALVLRAIFQQLNRASRPSPFVVPETLQSAGICEASGLLATPGCVETREWFISGTQPTTNCGQRHVSGELHASNPNLGSLRILTPTPGLRLAKDPRIVDANQAFGFSISEHPEVKKIEWIVDEKVAGETGPGVYRWLWPVRRGVFAVSARVYLYDEVRELPTVSFSVR